MTWGNYYPRIVGSYLFGQVCWHPLYDWLTHAWLVYDRGVIHLIGQLQIMQDGINHPGDTDAPTLTAPEG